MCGFRACSSLRFPLLLVLPTLCQSAAAFRGPDDGHGRSAITTGSRIPNQLVLTGYKSLADEPAAVQKNVERTLALSPGLRLRWLDDAQCRVYVKAHYDWELLVLLDATLSGNMRGDICRAAVLAREGGFYTDLDVELAVPLHELVDAQTTFMSAYENDGVPGGVLNALIAAAPQDEVIIQSLEELRKWDRRPLLQDGHMGPTTLGRAVAAVVHKHCPNQKSRLSGATTPAGPTPSLQWSCGPESMRLYLQDALRCPSECSPVRAASDFGGLRWGIFEPGEARRLVAWPRFEACLGNGCGGTGYRYIGLPSLSALSFFVLGLVLAGGLYWRWRGAKRARDI